MINGVPGDRSSHQRCCAAEDGYLLLKKIIPQTLVEAARQRAVRAVRESLDSHGLHPVVAHVMLVSNSWHDDPAIAGMTESAELFDVFETLFGEPAVTYDNKWMRGMAPGGHSAFHMDHIYMGLGSRQLITTWIPLHDVGWDTGGLAVLEGSSSLEGFARMRDTYVGYNGDTFSILSCFRLANPGTYHYFRASGTPTSASIPGTTRTSCGRSTATRR